MKASAGRSMAGALKVATRVSGGGRNWYGMGSQAASMSEVRPDALELAAATGNPKARNRRNPGEPGVTAKKGGGASVTGMSYRTSGGKAGGSKAAPASGASGKPGNPSVTGGQVHAKASNKKNVPGSSGTGSTSNNPVGKNVTQGSGKNQGSAAGDIPQLIQLAGQLGAQFTMQHLQHAQTALDSNHYPDAVVHLSRAHETARHDGNVQLMNAIQAAHGRLRQRTP